MRPVTLLMVLMMLLRGLEPGWKARQSSVGLAVSADSVSFRVASLMMLSP